MESKTLKITPPEGYEIDKQNSTFEEIVFKKIEKRLPMSWGELKEVKGYYIDVRSSITHAVGTPQAYSHNRNIFPSIKEAQAMLAMAQLCQLRDAWNEGWKPDWENRTENKYCIISAENRLQSYIRCTMSSPITFKTPGLRDKFLETFRELLEIAKPFL